jgi:hypothetical protein
LAYVSLSGRNKKKLLMTAAIKAGKSSNETDLAVLAAVPTSDFDATDAQGATRAINTVADGIVKTEKRQGQSTADHAVNKCIEKSIV